MQGRTEGFVLSIQNHEQVFNSMLDPVVIYEIDDQNDFVRMLDANQAFFKKYGYTEDQLPTLDFSMINAEGRQVEQYIKEIGTKGTFLFETIHRTSSNKIFPVEIHSRCVMLAGQKAIISIVRDISVRERDRKRLLESNKAKDTILKVVSHDLRSPLAQIHGVLQLLQAEGLSDNVKHYLELLDESRIHAENIVAELLATADTENDEEELKLQKVSVNEFCKKILEHYEIFVHSKKKIRLEHQIPETQDHILADEHKLIRVFDNIISNAVKFSEVGSTLKFSWGPCDGCVKFSVEDQGIGIPEELKDHIFDPHTKAKRQGTMGEKTIGLGMHISKSIVEKHGGKIWFESQQHQGTTFFVSIPLA